MAKIKVKGTVINGDVSGTLTAIGQIIEFSTSGAESETYDSTTLDTVGAGKEYSQTGYSEGGTVDFSMFFDPSLAGHATFSAGITVPAERDYSITFTDSASWAFTAAGVGLNVTGSMNEGLKADCSLKLDQLITY